MNIYIYIYICINLYKYSREAIPLDPPQSPGAPNDSPPECFIIAHSEIGAHAMGEPRRPRPGAKLENLREWPHVTLALA